MRDDTTNLNPTPELLDLHFRAMEADMAAVKAGSAWREAYEAMERLSVIRDKATQEAEAAYREWQKAKLAHEQAQGNP